MGGGGGGRGAQAVAHKRAPCETLVEDASSLSFQNSSLLVCDNIRPSRSSSSAMQWDLLRQVLFTGLYSPRTLRHARLTERFIERGVQQCASTLDDSLA